ncbi:uncharacterized protein [Nicotiana tomentosiformis]|uniref:uncharacterized protein n=1 Tax=Nicotiana tomentosiformis TaxID=4098 RepID=UPI00051B98A5|nr:uncharacterized protein LOC104119494 isoform X1 [Nicotiana tomentosiformis]XP_018634281.1 uncharacterized protein LOC104119494 isoform X1 [Nicotiana tomentosiformis]
MAPRGRPRKRLGRMDAAIDAMTPFGFDESLVRKTVNKLLKEYGGNDGWAFIEDCGYKELIEAILRDLESHDEGTTNLQEGVSSQDERAEEPALECTIDPSSTLGDSSCNTAGNTVGETACSELVNAVGEPTHEELCSNRQDISSTEVFCSLPAVGDGNSWKDVGKDQISTQKETANAVCRDGRSSGNKVQPGTNSHVFSPTPTHSPCPVKYLKICSESQVQSGSFSYVSNPPPTPSPCPVKRLPPPADHHPTTLPSSKGVSSQDERAVQDPALESTIGPLGILVDSTCNKAGNTVGETTCTELVNAVGELTYEELCSNKQDIGSTEVLSLLPAEGDGNRWKDIGEDKTATQMGTANAVFFGGGNSGSEVQPGSNCHVTAPPPTSSPSSVLNNLPPSSKRICLEPPRRRVPCYGWIESDDEDDADDFIQLPPMRPTINA